MHPLNVSEEKEYFVLLGAFRYNAPAEDEEPVVLQFVNLQLVSVMLSGAVVLDVDVRMEQEAVPDAVMSEKEVSTHENSPSIRKRETPIVDALVKCMLLKEHSDDVAETI